MLFQGKFRVVNRCVCVMYERVLTCDIEHINEECVLC